MTDRTTKILLASIAIGLWVNVAVMLMRPVTANAQYETDHILKSMDGHLSQIDLNIGKLQGGSCSNGKLCF
jgi:hypothetical protein